jgi:DnaA-homolog protein
MHCKYNFSVKQLVLELITAPLPTFDNFVIGRNREAVETLKSFTGADFQPILPKVVYLWGVSGGGKTHLLHALAAASMCPLMTAEILTDTPINELPSVVLTDQVHKLNDAAQVALFNAINHATAHNGKAVVAAGDVAPRDLPIRPELSSRLGSGLVFQLAALNDDEKADALEAHARTRGFSLRDDVIAYLLRYARRDMPSLMATLDALDQYSLETGREITLPLLKQMSTPNLF